MSDSVSDSESGANPLGNETPDPRLFLASLNVCLYILYNLSNFGLVLPIDSSLLSHIFTLKPQKAV